MLRELLAEGRTDDAVALVARLVARNHELERLLSEVKSKAKTNEGVSKAQLLLLLDGLPANSNGTLAEVDKKLRESSGIDQQNKDEKRRKKREVWTRRPLPQSLRRVDNIIAVPPDQRACPACGVERTCIGHDVTEVIDLIPAEVIVRRDVREKLACDPCDGQLVRAPLGDKVVPGGKMGTTLVAQVVAEKYYDGLPLSRQVERFLRLGLGMPISTLTDQVAWAAEVLRPLWRAAMEKTLRATVMHLDATSLPVLDRDSPRGIRTGSIWGYVGSQVSDSGAEHTALCIYASTGKRDGQKPGELGPGDVLARRTGLTVADAAGIFDAAFTRKDLIECGCSMHSRRYFTGALDLGDTRAALPVAAFKKLYDIEKAVRSATIDERRRIRHEQSKPVYDDLLAWAEAYQPHEPPSSALGRAIQYLLNHQLALRRFLTDGVIPIDNGIVERLHVRTALTRKAYLFAGSDAGGERAAIAYTVLGCCKLEDVDPVRYLADVLPRLSTKRVRMVDMPALLPSVWKLSHPEAILPPQEH